MRGIRRSRNYFEFNHFLVVSRSEHLSYEFGQRMKETGEEVILGQYDFKYKYYKRCLHTSEEMGEVFCDYLYHQCSKNDILFTPLKSEIYPDRIRITYSVSNWKDYGGARAKDVINAFNAIRDSNSNNRATN